MGGLRFRSGGREGVSSALAQGISARVGDMGVKATLTGIGATTGAAWQSTVCWQGALLFWSAGALDPWSAAAAPPSASIIGQSGGQGSQTAV